MESTFEINLTFWLGTTVMLFLALGLITTVILYQKKFVQAKQKEAELLLKTALESEKKERERIAKDLHDSVQNDLSAIQNYLYMIQKKSSANTFDQLMEETKVALQQTIANTRMISYKLMPPLLETRGFLVAMQDYFEQLNKNSSVHFTLQCNTNEVAISTNQGYELFRIFQEFTNNLLKYSQATSCSLFIRATKNGYVFELVDNGISFLFKEHYKNSKGLGIQNIQSRVKSLQGSLEQKNVPNGNHITLEIPL